LMIRFPKNSYTRELLTAYLFLMYREALTLRWITFLAIQ